MKHLTVTYGDQVLYDDTPGEFVWQESDSGFAIKAAPKQASILENLNAVAQAARQQQFLGKAR